VKSPASSHRARKLILIVEDELLIAMELEAMLEQAGYKVLGPVTNVSAALALLGRHRPDACILDVNLQGERASPVLKGDGVPFLISCAYEQAKLDREIAFAGAINIGKPASLERLLETLDAILKA
jgi:DNA-binding NtrC family response regulator